MKRWMGLVLLLALLLSACSSAEKPQERTEERGSGTTVERESDELAPNIPDDLRREEPVDYLIFTQGWYGYAPLDITDVGLTEEDSNDQVAQAAYYRDLDLTDKLNVRILNRANTECYDSMDLLRTNIMGGCEYDLVLLRSAVLTQAIANDLLQDLGGKKLTYLDPSKPWWSSDSYEALSVLGRHFGICGDFTVSDDLALWALYFNKDLRRSFDGMDNPYALVKSGEWTYDSLFSMAKQAARNLDNDPSMTYEDQWGVTYLRDTVSGMINSIGIRFGEKDEDGIPFISFYNEANVSKILKIFDGLYQTDVCYNIHARGGDEIAVFTSGRALFTFGGIYYAPQMRKAESNVNFGILPYPKYEVGQEKYISSTSSLFLTVLGIPKNRAHEDLTFKSAVMEEYAYLGRERVIPEFYDRLLIGKVAKDVETEKILDYIFGNVTYDIGNLFNFGDMAFRVVDMTMTSDRDIASVYGRYKSPAEMAIMNLLTKYSS